MKSGIYRIQIGDRFYFGQSEDLYRRDLAHLSYLRRGNHQNPFMQRAFDKHRVYLFEVLERCPVDALDAKEQVLLDAWVGHDDCMNIGTTAGAAMRGRRHTAETRALISARHQNRSPETRQRMRESHLKSERSKDSRRRLSVEMIGHTVSKETRDAISRTLSGRRAVRSAEHEANLRRVNSRPVVVVGAGLVFESLQACAAAFGVSWTSVYKAMRYGRPFRGLFIAHLDEVNHGHP